MSDPVFVPVTNLIISPGFLHEDVYEDGTMIALSPEHIILNECVLCGNTELIYLVPGQKIVIDKYAQEKYFRSQFTFPSQRCQSCSVCNSGAQSSIEPVNNQWYYDKLNQAERKKFEDMARKVREFAQQKAFEEKIREYYGFISK